MKHARLILALALGAVLPATASAGVLYSTGFEAVDGFALGYAPGQAGWTTLPFSSTIEPRIATANPAAGLQSLDFAYDATQGSAALKSARSPNWGPQPAGHYTLSVDVLITATDGADYSVIPQSASRAVARVDFSYLGNLQVRDGSGAAIDTGVPWTPGVYKTLTIDLDALANTIDYYYGGNLFYSSAVLTGPIIFGSSIDQVVIASDNYNLGEVGRFDNLVVTPEPGAASLLVAALAGLAMRRRCR